MRNYKGGTIMQTINNIYCIGRNYVEHVHELGNVVPEEPVVFNKPTHSLVLANENTIQLPRGRGDVHYEAELVLKMGTDFVQGITVDEIVSEMTIGLDLTLRDVQTELKEKSHPWLLSKGFPNSAVLGKFIPFPGVSVCENGNFTLFINDERVQFGEINKMIFPLQSIVNFIGTHLELKKNDIIFTGTPKGVGPLAHGDVLAMKWTEQVLGTARIDCD